MAKKEAKTNAMRMLESAGISYTEHTYDAEDGKIDGVSVAAKTGEDPGRVFKTLVTQDEKKNHFGFIIPVEAMLDLKACARCAGVKSVQMIPQKELLPLTGYVHGGCSPFGMKKPFPTFLDETAVLYDTILVSGGRIGTQVEVAPDDLLQLTGGSFGALTRE